jgi:hypothetical protein
MYTSNRSIHLYLYLQRNVLGLLEGGLGVGLAVALGRQLLHLHPPQTTQKEAVSMGERK